MARKARTPPPPRRPVQAPQRRADPRDPEARRRAFLILALSVVLGLAILGGVLLWLSTRDTADEQGVEEAMRAAGCTYRTVPAEGEAHVRDGTDVKYKTNPPASGNHYAVPVIWGAYEEPVEEERAVHNLEHGGIVIQYGDDVPTATVSELQDYYQSDPNGLLLAPLPGLGDEVVLTAWTRIARCNSFDETAFDKFKDEFRAKGPEARSVDDLAPGTAN